MKKFISIAVSVFFLMGCQSDPVPSDAVSGDAVSGEVAADKAVPLLEHSKADVVTEDQPLIGDHFSEEGIRTPTEEEWTNSFLSEIEAIEVFTEEEFDQLGESEPYEVFASVEGEATRDIAARHSMCGRKRSRFARFLNPGPQSGRGCWLKGRWFYCGYVQKKWSQGQCYYQRGSGSMTWGRCSQKGIRKNKRIMRSCPTNVGSKSRKGKRRKWFGGTRKNRRASGGGRGCMLKGQWRQCSYLAKMWSSGQCMNSNYKFRRCSSKGINKNKYLAFKCKNGESKRNCRRRWREHHRPRRVRAVRKKRYYESEK